MNKIKPSFLYLLLFINYYPPLCWYYVNCSLSVVVKKVATIYPNKFRLNISSFILQIFQNQASERAIYLSFSPKGVNFDIFFYLFLREDTKLFYLKTTLWTLKKRTITVIWLKIFTFYNRRQNQSKRNFSSLLY